MELQKGDVMRKLFLLIFLALSFLDIFGLSVVSFATDDPIAHWDFEQITGTTLIDRTGNGNDGLIEGVRLTQGILNQAGYFDGSDFIAVKNLYYNTAGAIPQMSVCAWVNTQVNKIGANENGAILDFDRSQYFSFAIRGDNGKLQFSTTDSSLKSHDFNGNTPVNDGQWHFVCASYTGVNKQLFVDGQLDATSSNPHNGLSLGTGQTRYGFIGDSSKANSFNGDRDKLYYEGSLDEVRLYDRALSVTEMNGLYHQFKGSPGNYAVEAKITDEKIQHFWYKLVLEKNFQLPPIVIAAIQTYNEIDTAGVRMNRLSSDEFDVKIEEEKSLDMEEDHVAEKIGYMVFHQGNIVNNAQTTIGEAGEMTVNQPDAATWHNVIFNNSYLSPVVVAQINTFSESEPAHVRIRNVTSASFQFQIEEWMYQDKVHASETVSYVVIEKGIHVLLDGRRIEVGKTTANTGWKTVSFQQPFGEMPVVTSLDQTRKDGTPIVTRHRNIINNSFQLKVEEEEALQSGGHTKETIGYIASEVFRHIPLQPAHGDPLPGLTPQQLERFNKGKGAFTKEFGFNDTSLAAQASGPIRNLTSCVACHGNIAPGGSQSGITQNVIRFGKDTDGTFDPLTHLGGSLLQKTGKEGCSFENIPAEANVTTIRISPPVFGSGLIESIPDQDILAYENDPQTGGKAHRVFLLEDPTGPERVGRFGWKAQLASTLSFAADAANNEMGITSTILPDEQQPNAPTGSGVCSDGIPDPDDVSVLGGTFIQDVRDFMHLVAAPPQTPKSGMRGEQVFINIGCVDCHVPSFTTAVSTNEEALSQKEVKAYSDFLLHDMGALGDGIAQGNATQKQMRTAPLWDVRNRIQLLHDGRGGSGVGGSTFAEQINAVINEHGRSPEAQTSVNNFSSLSQSDKDALVVFLTSLGRREFDHDDRGGDVGISDFQQFHLCYDDPEQNFDVDHPCAISDVDQDGDVDMTDFNSFLTVYQGPVTDCQCNGVEDLREILNGTAQDSDNNASPDECHVDINMFALPVQSGSDVQVIGGNFSILLRSSGHQPGDRVEFFYSFNGQGQGLPFGDAFCINLANPLSLGTMVADSTGFTWFEATAPFQTGASTISFQAGILNNGTNSKKSNVVTVNVLSSVNNTNRLPVLDPIDNKIVTEGQLLQFSLNASDPDGDPLNYTFSVIEGSSFPEGATLNNSNGQFSWTPAFDQAGDYELEFTVSDGNLSDSQGTTISVIDSIPWISIVASDATAVEPSDPGTFKVTRGGGSGTAASLVVSYTTGGTADKNGNDYTALSGSVTIPANATSAKIKVFPKDDGLAEGRETIVVNLKADARYTIVTPTATVYLHDDEKPTVSITATDSSASEPGTNTGQFRISQIPATPMPKTISCTLDGIAAKDGTDYLPVLPGLATIPANASSVTITVTPQDDGAKEVKEMVIITLSPNAGYYLVSPTSATVNITDND